MSKYVNKTQPNDISPIDFINSQANKSVIQDCLDLLKIFEKVTGFKPIVWGKIIGFGKYHYISKSCEADWFVSGFAPRASTIVIYTNEQVENMDELSQNLGKHKISGSCLHIKKLSDINQKVLEQIIQKGMEYMKLKYKIY